MRDPRNNEIACQTTEWDLFDTCPALSIAIKAMMWTVLASLGGTIVWGAIAILFL